MNNGNTKNGLVQCCISHRCPDTAIYVSVYADLVKVKRANQQAPKGGPRGKVAGFSRASRKRFLENMAMTRNAEAGAFITLTYPGEYSPDPLRWKRDLDVFLKRLKRIQPNVAGFWRLEFQQRGAPHFHLLVFGLTTSAARLRTWVRLAWFKVVGSGDERHLRVGTRTDAIKSRRHAMNYASKYAAKQCDDEIEAGRLWGKFGRLDQRPTLNGHYSMNTYIVIRRIIIRFLKSKLSDWARRLAKRGTQYGFTVFGLGDMSNEVWSDFRQSTIYRILTDAIGVSPRAAPIAA